MSLVSLEEAQSRAGDSITQDQVDEAEEELAALIGPLIGSRSETFYLSLSREPQWIIDGLYLKRYTDFVTLTSDGDSLTSGTDFRLLDHHLIERIDNSARWGDTLVATYEPNDEERVRAVLFDWLTYRQMPTGLQSIRIGAFSETYYPTSGANQGSRTRPSTGNPVISGFLRRILPSAGLGAYSGPFRFSHTRRDRTLIVGSGS